MNIDSSGLAGIALAAALTENMVLSRQLGICPAVRFVRSPSAIAGMGGAVVLVTTVSVPLNTSIQRLILDPMGLGYASLPIFLAVIALLVHGCDRGMKRFLPGHAGLLGVFLPLLTVNCAILGASIFSVAEGLGILQSTVYGFFSGLGWLLATALLHGLSRRLEYARPPLDLRGLPLLLIALAMVSMAFSGFSGMGAR